MHEGSPNFEQYGLSPESKEGRETAADFQEHLLIRAEKDIAVLGDKLPPRIQRLIDKAKRGLVAGLVIISGAGAEGCINSSMARRQLEESDEISMLDGDEDVEFRSPEEEVTEVLSNCDTGDLSGRVRIMVGGNRVSVAESSFPSGHPFQRCITRDLGNVRLGYGIRGVRFLTVDVTPDN